MDHDEHDETGCFSLRNPTPAGSGDKKARAKLKHHGLGHATPAFVIKHLGRVVEDRKQQCEQLQHDNSNLRAKEKVLLEAISSQGGNLHFVALAAMQQADNDNLPDGIASSMAASLIQDVKVQQLLRLVGDASSGTESYITRCMRAACTPERLEQFKSETLESIANQLRQLTMRMAVLLQADDVVASCMSDRLEDVVDAYTEIAMLLHVTADSMNFEIGALNLETMQRQEQPESQVLRVISRLELRPEQIQHLTAAFQVYVAKSRPIVAEIHQLVKQMQQITGADDMLPWAAAAAEPSAGAEAEQTSICDAVKADAAHALQCNSNPALESWLQQEQQLGQHQQQQLQPDQQQQEQQHLQQLRSCSSTSSTSHQALPAADTPGSRGSARAAAVAAASKPWQQFGLAQGGLTVEAAELLEELLQQFLTSTMHLRELHRTVTFTWINTLDYRQKALNIMTSYPFYSVPLLMCKKILELQETRVSRSTSLSDRWWVDGA